MTKADNIEKKIEQINFKSTPAMRNRILSEATQAMEETINAQADKPSVRRILMQSKMTKLAVAAVVIIAVVIGLNPFGGRIGVTSVALAEVAKKVEQINNCAFKKTTTVYSKDNETNIFSSSIHYTQGDVREDIYDNEGIVRQVYVNFLKGTVTGVNHKFKIFGEMDLTDEDIEQLSPIGPKNFISVLLSKGKYKKLGRKIVDGVLLEGFEFYDKRATISMEKDRIKNISTRFWVDVNTNLPIRVELDAVLVNNMKAHVVQYDPQWDVELKPDFFEPKIPAGYIHHEQRGFVGINLENWPTLKVTPGMAAEKAGIKDGDIVLKVNGNSISHIKSSTDAYNLLLGKIGEKVVLTIKRGEETVTFEIEREAFPDRN